VPFFLSISGIITTISALLKDFLSALSSSEIALTKVSLFTYSSVVLKRFLTSLSLTELDKR
jgi:hypothetical protein